MRGLLASVCSVMVMASAVGAEEGRVGSLQDGRVAGRGSDSPREGAADAASVRAAKLAKWKAKRETRAREMAESERGASAAPLLLMDRRYRENFSDGEFTIQGAPVFVSEVENSGRGTGFNVWDGAVVLSKYLEREYQTGFAGLEVLELGCGTGLVGLSAGVLGAKRAWLTDLPKVLENLRWPIRMNRGRIPGELEVFPLDWTSPEVPTRSLDVVLAADVVWVPELIDPLVNTMRVLTEHYVEEAREAREFGEQVPPAAGPASSMPGVGPLVIFSHQTRALASDKQFFDGLQALFHLQQVPKEELAAGYDGRDVITVWNARRRIDSA